MTSPLIAPISPTTIVVPAGGARNRSVVAAVIGTFVEFYDWTIYAFMAPIFAASIFPASSPLISLLMAFSTFALGYVARPLGAFLLGVYGDRIGRRSALTAAILIMAVCSMIIGLVPDYATIGIAAPITIVVARCLQGLAAGGEGGSAQAYLAELSKPGKRAGTTCLQQISTGVSTLFALAVSALLAAILSDAQLASWGWRIPFIIGGVLGLFGLYLRRHAAETLSVATGPEAVRLGFKEILGRSGRQVARMSAATLLPSIAFFSWQVYLPTYIVETAHLSHAQALGIATLGTILFIALIYPFAMLSDRIGRKPMMIAFAVATIAWGYPTFIGLPTFAAGFTGALVVALVGNAILALMGGTLSALITEAFPANVRATGAGLTQAISAVFAGATFPPIVTALLGGQRYDLIYGFVAVIGIISLIATLCLKETGGRAVARQ